MAELFDSNPMSETIRCKMMHADVSLDVSLGQGFGQQTLTEKLKHFAQKNPIEDVKQRHDIEPNNPK